MSEYLYIQPPHLGVYGGVIPSNLAMAAGIPKSATYFTMKNCPTWYPIPANIQYDIFLKITWYSL